MMDAPHRRLSYNHPMPRRLACLLAGTLMLLSTGCDRSRSTTLAVIVIDVSPSARPSANGRGQGKTTRQDAAAAIIGQRCREARTAIANLEAQAQGEFRFQLVQVGSASSQKPKTLLTWRELNAAQPSPLATPRQLEGARIQTLAQLERDCVARAVPTSTSPIHMAMKEALIGLNHQAQRLKNDPRRRVYRQLVVMSDFVDPHVLRSHRDYRKQRERAERTKSARRRGKYEARAEAIALTLALPSPARSTELCGLADSHDEARPDAIRAAWQLVTPSKISPSCAQTDLPVAITEAH